MSSGVERFALKTQQEGLLGGVGMAVHAIPDALCILHGGVGCKYKYSSALHAHDRARPQQPSAYTEITDADLTGGSAARIGPYVRSWYQRREPGFMVVATVTFLEMTGESFAAEVAEVAKTVPCPLAYVPCLGFEGDLYEGYAAVVLEVLRRVPFAKARPKSNTVSVVGHLFDRYELDQTSNLEQMRLLLAPLGLKLGPVLLSGRPFAELLEAADSGVLVGSPYLGAALGAARDLVPRPIVPAGLPVGVAGTFRWFRDVAAAAGVSSALVQALHDKLADFASRQLAIFRAHLHHLWARPRSAIFADAPLAAGLATLMVEAEVPPALIGLRSRSLGGRAELLREAERIGVPLPADVEILQGPSLQAVRACLSELERGGDLAAVVGSTLELNCVPPQTKAARVELGYPSTGYHAITPSAFFGVHGALGICQRIMNQLDLRG